MRQDHEGKLEAVITAVRLGDGELAASFFAADCDFTVFIPSDPGAYGGQIVGRAAVQQRYERVFQDFKVLRYEACAVTVVGDEIRAQVRYEVSHRATREVLDGVGRVESTFVEGKISRWHEFHDADRIQAYLRLCLATEAFAVPYPASRFDVRA